MDTILEKLQRKIPQEEKDTDKQIKYEIRLLLHVVKYKEFDLSYRRHITRNLAEMLMTLNSLSFQNHFFVKNE